MIYRSFLKPLGDRVVASIALLVLSPLLAVIAAAVFILNGRPVLFQQQRTGLNGRAFTIVKFRTMRSASSRTETDAQRLVGFGRFLRSTSLDELPELWNVVAGDMSLVGPRPLHTFYLSRYSAEQARRHEVKPGITGWAQVHGRNASPWHERLANDVWYVDHLGFLLDVRIIAMTLRKVIAREGIAEAGHDTSSEFEGTSTKNT